MCNDLKIKINNATFDIDNYIGSYALENCEAYGALGIISGYNNMVVQILIKKETNDVIIASTDNNKLGKLCLPDTEKKGIILNLKQNWGDTLYTCKLMIIDNKPKVGIWVNKKM